MDANDDFYGKEAHLNCFQMHTIFEQTKPKLAIVQERVMMARVRYVSFQLSGMFFGSTEICFSQAKNKKNKNLYMVASARTKGD